MKWNTDRIVSISAMIVSVGTLFLIMYQTHLNRKAQFASVMPYLQISLSFNDGKGNQSINIANTGLGPALVKGVYIKDGGTVLFEGNPSTFARQALGDSLRLLQGFSNDLLLPGSLLPANEGKRVFSHSRLGPYGNFISKNFKFTYNTEGKYLIEIIYESVYGQRWVITSDNAIPKLVD